MPSLGKHVAPSLLCSHASKGQACLAGRRPCVAKEGRCVSLAPRHKLSPWAKKCWQLSVNMVSTRIQSQVETPGRPGRASQLGRRHPSCTWHADGRWRPSSDAGPGPLRFESQALAAATAAAGAFKEKPHFWGEQLTAPVCQELGDLFGP